MTELMKQKLKETKVEDDDVMVGKSTVKSVFKPAAGGAGIVEANNSTGNKNNRGSTSNALPPKAKIATEKTSKTQIKRSGV